MMIIEKRIHVYQDQQLGANEIMIEIDERDSIPRCEVRVDVGFL